jgi:soluble lytic murein transglycosylase
MQKKALVLSLLGVSAASLAGVAVGVRTALPPHALPAAVQTYPPAVHIAPEALPPSHLERPVPGAIASSIARWTSLRQSDGLPFSSYASFLIEHRGWPGEAAMRRTAERANADSASPNQVIAFFRAYPPLSPAGHAKLASALLAGGRVEDARAEAKKAWIAGALPKADEDRLVGQFGGAFTPLEHDLRMDALLDNGDTQSAGRLLSFVSSAKRPVAEARLALQTRASDAASRASALGGIEGDAGLLMDRANWMRQNGQSASARQLLAQPRRLTRRPANPEKWFETLLVFARGAANDSQWTTAYQIASQFDEAYEPGTDVSLRPYGERDEYTNLAWLAGNAAVRLGRHADAARMFDRYGRAARSPQTRSKGFYWAARSAFHAGQAAQSNAWIEQAAANPDQFYGQLALERLGRRVTPPSPAAAAPTPAERNAFASKPLVQALRALGDMGRWSDQTLFVRAVAEQAEGDRERGVAAEYGRSIGRPDLGVWLAREARNKGQSFYTNAGFPEVSLPGAYSHNWAIAHGITRQESSFDRAAVSHAGARGLMQLMPGTAREEAGKLGLPYDFARLTNDPAYNVMLGSSYFQRLLNQWGGSVPLAVASYNAGAGNVRKWVRERGDPRQGGDIVKWIEEIPFSETRNYVQRVLENAVVYEAMRSRGASQPNRLSYYLGKGRPG